MYKVSNFEYTAEVDEYGGVTLAYCDKNGKQVMRVPVSSLPTLVGLASKIQKKVLEVGQQAKGIETPQDFDDDAADGRGIRTP